MTVGSRRALLNQPFDYRSLFRNGEQGAVYLASDFNSMYQDSTGITPVTAVEQPVGLVLDKRLGMVRGAEIWNDASVGFSGGSSRVSPGVYRVFSSDGSLSEVFILNSVTNGAWYEVTFTIDSVTTAGGGLRVGASAGVVIAATVGVKRCIVLNDSTSAIIKRVSGVTDVQISNVSFKALSGNHASQATAASRPTLSARYNLLDLTDFQTAWTTTGVEPTANTYPGPETINGASTKFYRYRRVGASGFEGAQRSVSLAANVSYNFPCWVRIPTGVTATELRAYDGVATYLIATAATLNAQAKDIWVAYSTTFTPAAARTFFSICSTVADGVGNGYDVALPDLRTAADAALNIPAYQRVNTATDYDTAGFQSYWKLDGFDDGWATATTDFTGTDKVTVWAGVTKLSDSATGGIVELSATATSGANLGSWGAFSARPGADANYGFAACGSTVTGYKATTFTSPNSAVLSCGFDIAGAALADEIAPRVNGVIPTLASTDGAAAGTGNFGSYPLYVGRRGGTTSPLNGRIYGLIVRGAASSASQIAAAERYIARRMGITTL